MGLHVVGNVCLDTTYRVGRFPLPGETLAALASWTGVGGKGANQSLAAVRAGAQVSLHAAIGEDAGAVRLRSELGRERLGLDLVVHRGPSDTSVILLREDGENLIVSETSRALAFDPMAADCAFASTLRAGDVVLLQGNLSPGATAGVIELTRGSVRISASNVRLGRDGVGTVGLPRPIRQTLLNALSTNIKADGLPFAVTPTRLWVETGSIVVEGTATNVSLRQAGVAAATR